MYEGDGNQVREEQKRWETRRGMAEKEKQGKEKL